MKPYKEYLETSLRIKTLKKLHHTDGVYVKLTDLLSLLYDEHKYSQYLEKKLKELEE